MEAKLKNKAKKIGDKPFAFTLVELLVAVAIIAILAGLLLPALARSKARALNVVCVNHFKQLMVCWRSYADDNQGRLVSVFYY